MKTYILTKTIQAVPAKMVNGSIWPDGLPLPEVKDTGCQECGCVAGNVITEGYLYTTGKEDRFPMFMDAEEFGNCCRPCISMPFGDALEAMKDGKRVAREGWNDKGMYIFLAYEPDFNTPADLSAFADKDVEVGDMIVMKTAQDTFAPGWLASQADMLAEDWFVVE